jgi:hypothetical protein
MLDIVNTLKQSNDQLLAERQAMMNRPAPAPAPTVDPNLVLEDPAKFVNDFNAAVQYQAAGNIANAAGPIYQAQAAQARALAENRHADTFNRYGAEIQNVVNMVPVDKQTVDMYDEVVRYVKGLHVDELVQERAAELAATSQPISETVSYSLPDGGSTTGNDLQEKLGTTPLGQRLLNDLGWDGIRQHCKQSGTDVTKYVDDVLKSNVHFTGKGGWISNLVE